MDVSDIVDYNIALLNLNDLSNSYFCLSKDDPTNGFAFDASSPAGNAFPEASDPTSGKCKYNLPISASYAKSRYFLGTSADLGVPPSEPRP
jgi:DNA polymerase iota